MYRKRKKTRNIYHVYDAKDMDSGWNQYKDRNGKGIKQIFTYSTQKMSTLSAQSIALFMSELENLHANCLSSFRSSVAGAIKNWLMHHQELESKLLPS